VLTALTDTWSEERPRPGFNQWRNIMRKPAIVIALALFSTVFSTQLHAQSFSEPAAFASQHPDRDVLNGGVLTPEARAAAGLENARGAFAAVGGTQSFAAHRAHAGTRRHR